MFFYVDNLLNLDLNERPCVQVGKVGTSHRCKRRPFFISLLYTISNYIKNRTCNNIDIDKNNYNKKMLRIKNNISDTKYSYL